MKNAWAAAYNSCFSNTRTAPHTHSKPATNAVTTGQSAPVGCCMSAFPLADVSPTNKKEDPGTFVSSQPPSGSKVTAGSVVTYHLAKATAASPSPSATKSGP